QNRASVDSARGWLGWSPFWHNGLSRGWVRYHPRNLGPLAWREWSTDYRPYRSQQREAPQEGGSRNPPVGASPANKDSGGHGRDDDNHQHLQHGDPCRQVPNKRSD